MTNSRDEDDSIHILSDQDLSEIAGGIKLPYPTRDDGPVIYSAGGNDTITSIGVIDDFSTVGDTGLFDETPNPKMLKTP